MNDHQIRCFLEAAREKNFTRAAENLYLTQPGISRTIAQLEKELGAKLFLRSAHKQSELTESGKIFYQTFLRWSDEFQTAKEKSDMLQRDSNMVLRFGYATGWSISDFLPYMLNTLQNQFPYLNLDLQSHPIERLRTMVSSNTLDLVLTIKDSKTPDNRLEERPICKISKVVIYSENCPDLPEEVESLTDFSECTFYFFSGSPDSSREEFCAMCRLNGFAPRIRIVPNQSTMLSLVENGNGAAIMDLWSQPVHMNNMQYFKLNSEYTTVLVYRKSCEPSEVIQALCQAMQTSIYPPDHTLPDREK